MIAVLDGRRKPVEIQQILDERKHRTGPVMCRPDGSPIKDFVLETDAIFDAERRLVAEMHRR